MNIAMLSYHTCPLATLGGKDTGGMNVYVAELTRHLGAMGIHVDVFTRSQDEHVPHVIHSLGYGNRVVHIPAGPEVYMPKKELAGYIPAFAAQVEAFAEAKGIHYDLIHSHYWMSGIAAETLNKKWHAPLLQMFHTLGLMKRQIAQTADEMEGDYRIEGEKQVMAMADRIVAATPAEQKQLEDLYHVDPGKIVIIPPGVETSRFYPINPDEAREAIELGCDKKMLLFVGRIEPLKGLANLIRALAIIRKKGKCKRDCYCLVVIGGDPESSSETMSSEMRKVKELCRELGMDDLVLFLGKRAQDTLPYYYSAADILIMPSYYESFGLVALEAMACETPVVASQVGGLPYLVKDGETGFVVPGGDPEALVDPLNRLMNDAELRERMGKQAAAHARKYAWELIAGQILDVYRDLLKSSQ